MSIRSSKFAGRMARAIGALTLLGAVGVWTPSVSAGDPISDTAVGFVTDCTWGPLSGYGYGEISPTEVGPGLGFATAVVRNQNCIAIQFMTNGESLNNGVVEVTLPKGMTVTKRIAAPTNATYFDVAGCTWGGSFSLKAAGTAQTLSLRGVNCSTDSYLAAFFTTTVKVPVTTTYLPFNLFNIITVTNGLDGCFEDDAYEVLYRIFGPSAGNVAPYGPIPGPFSGYLFKGRYSLSKTGSFMPMDNSGDPNWLYQVVPDLDYYNWLNWWYYDFVDFDGCS